MDLDALAAAANNVQTERTHDYLTDEERDQLGERWDALDLPAVVLSMAHELRLARQVVAAARAMDEGWDTHRQFGALRALRDALAAYDGRPTEPSDGPGSSDNRRDG